MSARYWHGGPAIKGDALLPPIVTGRARVCHGDEWVYISRTRELALNYAATCNGWLYEVEPLGEPEQDPDSILTAGDSMRCRGARIHRRFKPSAAEVAEIASVIALIDAALFGGAR